MTQPFYIDATTNLIQWQTIQTILSPNGVGVFSDPDASLYPRRFYRGRITP